MKEDQLDSDSDIIRAHLGRPKRKGRESVRVPFVASHSVLP